ncbi:MAG TPA: hypothetical protein ENI13_01430 [candidate division CPR3 bacterium]|uniref:XRE family transcriptional regulator n=1 Tax=candidate division CPR3 bacterium TaxID=2268181 RepID=A0A7C1T7G1_UNCC3|nr:hypothetical protein [candidate division CPR3 bacterium]
MKKVAPQEIITNLVNKFGITKEILAGKMGVTTITIFRWQYSKTKPTYAELKLLNQIYRGYKSKKGGKK